MAKNIVKYREKGGQKTGVGFLDPTIIAKVPLPEGIKGQLARIGAGTPLLIGGIAIGAVSKLSLKGKLRTLGYIGSAAMTLFGIYKLMAPGKGAKAKSVLQSVFLSGQLPVPNIATSVGRSINKAKGDLKVTDIGLASRSIKGVHEVVVEVENVNKKLTYSVVVDLYKANIEQASRKPIGEIDKITSITLEIKPGRVKTWTIKVPNNKIEEWKKQPGDLKLRFVVFSVLDYYKISPVGTSAMMFME